MLSKSPSELLSESPSVSPSVSPSESSNVTNSVSPSVSPSVSSSDINILFPSSIPYISNITSDKPNIFLPTISPSIHEYNDDNISSTKFLCIVIIIPICAFFLFVIFVYYIKKNLHLYKQKELNNLAIESPKENEVSIIV